MVKYRILDDVAIADVAFEIFGKNENELFENAALAIAEQTSDIKSIEGKQKKVIELTSETLETLLFDFLSELIYLKDVHQIIFKKSKVSITKGKDGTYSLKATVSGDIINQKKHILKSDIKAITYHMFKVEETPKGLVAFVVVDI